MSKRSEEDSVKTGKSDPELKPLRDQRRSANCLTILFHPQLRRIGERCLLTEMSQRQSVKLSRTEPLFAPPGGSAGESLAIPAISRSPLVLVPMPKRAVRILPGEYSMPVKLNGLPLMSEVLLSAEDLKAGVVLELSDSIILLLHRYETFLFKEERSRAVAQASGLVGHSTALIDLHLEIAIAASHDKPVLICGETGSGKELVAAAIHRLSPRGTQDLISINMAAISPSLAKAELFGAERGSYTGAITRQDGFFRRAHHSTLFLDEVGDTPGDAQGMLLRTLETKTVQALGSQRDELVDVRLISATDADLMQAIADGRFREPLYYRLAGQVIYVPPLRNRRDDIGRLLVHFLVQELKAMGREPDHIQAVLDDPKQHWLPFAHVAPLMSYPWPGNVRQLRNRASQIVIAARTGLELPPMPAVFEREQAKPRPGEPSQDRRAQSTPKAPAPRTKAWSPRDMSDEAIEEALRVNDWEIAAAADALGCSRQLLYSRIRESARLRTLEEIPDQEFLAAYDACGGDIARLSMQLKVSRRAIILRLRRMKMWR